MKVLLAVLTLCHIIVVKYFNPEVWILFTNWNLQEEAKKTPKLCSLYNIWFCLTFTASGNNLGRRAWFCSWCCLQLEERAPGVQCDGAEHEPAPAPTDFCLLLLWWIHPKPPLMGTQGYSQGSLQRVSVSRLLQWFMSASGHQVLQTSLNWYLSSHLRHGR